MSQIITVDGYEIELDILSVRPVDVTPEPEPEPEPEPGDRTFNVLDYGADPTGESDSTAAIQRAIDAAQGELSIVFFPEGRYRVQPPGDADTNPDNNFDVNYTHRVPSCFQLGQENSNTHFVGDNAELVLYCWGGGHPGDYEVVDGEVIHSAVPRSRRQWNDSRGYYQRGAMFIITDLEKDNVECRNIHFFGLTLNGNTTANGDRNWYTPLHYLTAWDTSHKAIIYSFKGEALYDMLVDGCTFIGWRGEVLYGGGSHHKGITIRNCEISESNASAISISGDVLIENVYMYRVYNGIENYAHSESSQFTEVRNCIIDLSGYGENGVVYIAEDGETECICEGLTVIGARAGIYFDGSAHDVTIADSEFVDCTDAIRMWNINAGTYDLTPGWENFRFRNVTVRAATRKISFGILQAQSYQPLGAWDVDGLNMVSEGGNRIAAAIKIASNHADNQIAVRNSSFIDTQQGVIGGGTPPIYEGDNNKISADRINAWTLGGKTLHLHPMVPKVEVVNLPEAGLAGVEFADPQLYPDGWEFELSNLDRSGVRMTVAGVILAPGDAATLVALGGQFSVSNFEEGKYA